MKMFGAKKILLKNDSYENEATEAKSLLNISAFCVSSGTRFIFSNSGGIWRSGLSSRMQFEIFQKFLTSKLGSLRAFAWNAFWHSVQVCLLLYGQHKNLIGPEPKEFF